MIFKELELKGAYLIELELLEDKRGFFARNWCQREFAEAGLNVDIKQANISSNIDKYTLRGMHFQKDPFQEVKIIRCTRGAIYDVIVDLRPDSETFKKWVGVELTQRNYKMLYVPENFAHGYITLEDDSEVMYFVTQFYTPGAEGGMRWNDPQIGIKWPVEPVNISEKDQSHSDFIQ
jgi:dTDP-4-dehydrorhamnose 3,5-epimerase